jgi:hypothetical protein
LELRALFRLGELNCTGGTAETGHIRSLALEMIMLTQEEFASLLLVGRTPAVNGPPAVIPPEHSVRLIALGYMADIAGRLRMTTPGRLRIAAGVPNHEPAGAPILDGAR